jgi:threonine/homoserine/homoserine lactone efflux protein
MLDSSFLAFAGVAALLVLSPGATWAVVADGAIDGGPRAGLWTVAGVGTANFSLAMASAFGLSAVFHRFPEVLHVLAVCGALYMVWLGVRAIRRAITGQVGQLRRVGQVGGDPTGAGISRTSRFGRGLLTNYTNVSVVLFYTVVVPQFISSRDSFLGRYLLLGQTHVAMSIVWLSFFALFVGTLADKMTRPSVRRTLDAVTGCALLAFAAKIALSA